MAIFLTAAAAADPPRAHAAARCAPADASGGEWRSYGHDYRNTRYQPAERTIGPAEAATLGPVWSFSVADAGGTGDFTGTPVVADGCVYAATSEGWAFALNADTGEVVWKRKLPNDGPVDGTVFVKGGRVYIAATGNRESERCTRGSCFGPFVVALRQRTGKVDWVSRALDTQPGADIFASPVVFKDVLMIGVSGGAAELGDEADRHPFQGSISFLDADSGRVLRKTWTIHSPKRNSEDEFAGATVWSTPAVDRRAEVAYVGTSNPFRPQAEHKHANAVIKLDVDRGSRRFGRIIGSYKGQIDEYIPEYSELPCVDIPGNPPPWYPQGIGQCGDIDLDFGASPNIFKVGGRKLVGAGQKSGVYHVFDAKTMKPVWSEIVGVPTSVGGIVGSTAYDGEAIYGPVTIPGYVWSLGAESGSLRWLGPLADGLHWGPPVAVANGVVYTVDLTGFLAAFDASTGLPLSKRPLLLGTEHSQPVITWGGVSVARNTVYASVGLSRLPSLGGFIAAFRPGG